MLLPLLQNNLLGVTLPPPAIQEIVPYLIGQTEDSARVMISQIYCIADVTGTTGTVTAQSPDAFTLTDRASTISITLGGTVNSSSRRKGRSRGQPPYGYPSL